MPDSSFSPEIADKLERMQQRIQQADALEQAQQTEEALAAYHACLQFVVQENIPLLDEHLVHIWIGIGFCYADRGNWREALEWYHRAEAAIFSSPPFNPHPDTPEAQAQARKWSVHLPKGATAVFSQSFPAHSSLAALCDSIALAYDNANQLEQAQAYYQGSTALYARLGNSQREAEVLQHQALGCQRRQEWFNLEQVADKMLQAATQVQDPPLKLAARRFLAQSQINQNRPFKTLEHLGQAVLLGCASNDPKTNVDEKLLRSLVGSMRTNVLQRGQADFLEPLVAAEIIIDDPNLPRDRALLEKLQREQPFGEVYAALPVGALRSLSSAIMVLEHFALRHCGAPTQTAQRPKKGFLNGLRRATESVERCVWMSSQEEMQTFQMDEHDQLSQVNAPCAILTLFGKPEVIISVSLTSRGCCMQVMKELALPDIARSGFVTEMRMTIPAQSEDLLNCLNSLIQRGVFAKTDQGLQYVGIKPA